MGAEDYFGKKVTFFINNKQVSGIIKGFKLPGYVVKGEGIPKDTRIPAMAIKFMKVEGKSKKEDDDE